MRVALTVVFFLFLNFLLILMPVLMPNKINTESTIFWIFWVNGLFILSMILPNRASYIFDSETRGSLITKAILRQLDRTTGSYSDADLEADKKNLQKGTK